MQEFFAIHWLDILTTALGLAYIFLEYKASLYLWLVALVMQSLDVVLYYQHGLYADCGMEFYYISMTVYGFVNWKYLKTGKDDKPRTVTHFERRFILPWTLATLALWALIYFVLVRFTDSTVPLTDSFTTALSFVACWALARKYLEQWLIWMVVNIVTCVLYFYKGIPFKASYYGLYVIISVAGYLKWRKMLNIS